MNRLFQGEAHNFPKRFTDEKELLEYIQNTNGAIGYISSETIPENVKVIQVN